MWQHMSGGIKFQEFQILSSNHSLFIFPPYACVGNIDINRIVQNIVQIEKFCIFCSTCPVLLFKKKLKPI